MFFSINHPPLHTGETANKDLYTFLHSAELHEALQFATCRAIPNFDESMGDVCKHVLGGVSFKAPIQSFSVDDKAMLKACLKACVFRNLSDMT